MVSRGSYPQPVPLMMAPRLLAFLLLMIVVFVFVLDQNGHFCFAMTVQEKISLKAKVLEMFQHAYGAYMANAYPADELMPLSCRGRWRGTEPSRGDVDDSLGNFTLTLVDTLDTLAILGDIPEFERVAKLIISHTKFDTDVIVSVFETNIRVLGGLLGGHVIAAYLKRKRFAMEWYKDELLSMAKEVGTRLLPAFNTTTGIPYPRINLKHGIDPQIRAYQDTCTACAGTMILEFAALSRLTGDPVFEDKAHKAMDYLWNQRHRSSDLVGTVINIHNGDWIRRESGVGAGIDSYYEYVLKAYILLGDDTYLTRFNKHYDAIMKYVSQGPLFVDVHMHKPLTTSRHFMDALLAFWPGLQVLKGDIEPAIEMHEMLYQVIQRHKFLPEAFTSDFRVHWGQHPLRPEFVESTYFLYKATGDHHYLDVGKKVIENLDKHARVPCGFAAIKDVTKGTHEDQMDSYVLAETFKYLFLLYAEKSDLILDVDDYVFTTEAHLLPLSLSISNYTRKPKKLRPEMYSHLREIDEEPDVFLPDGDHNTCSNPSHKFRPSMNYAQNLRANLKGLVSQTAPQQPQVVSSCPVAVNQGQLRAEDFVVGNKPQLQQLQSMGIELITMTDGRIQLLHTATKALSPALADEGLAFMQDMIALSKSESKTTQHDPMIVQLIGPPFNGNVIYNAGPAQFGYDLKAQGMVAGELQAAEPFKACTPVTNAASLRGRIAMLERGDCMFVDKARHLQNVGAIGGIVIDHNLGTSGENQPLFAMSGDGTDDVTIPMLFLFNVEGSALLEACTKHPGLRVQMAAREAVYGEQREAILEATGPAAFETLQSEHEPVSPDIITSQSEQEEKPVSLSDQEKPYIKRVIKLNPLEPVESYTYVEPKAEPGTNEDVEYTMSAGTDQVQLEVKINPIKSYPKSPEVRSDDVIMIDAMADGSKLMSFRFDNIQKFQSQPDLPVIYDAIVKTLLDRTNFATLRKQAEYLSAFVRLLEAAYLNNEKLDLHTQDLMNELGNLLEITPSDELDDYESDTDEQISENEKNSESSESVVYNTPSGEYLRETRTINDDGVTVKVHTKMVKPPDYHTGDTSYASEEDLTESHIYLEKVPFIDSVKSESIREGIDRKTRDDSLDEHDISGRVPSAGRHKQTSQHKSSNIDNSRTSEEFIDLGDGINIEVESSSLDIDSLVFDNINEELSAGLKKVLEQVSSMDIDGKNIKFIKVTTKNTDHVTSSREENRNIDNRKLTDRDSEQTVFQVPVDVEMSVDSDPAEANVEQGNVEEVRTTRRDNAQADARRKRGPGDL